MTILDAPPVTPCGTNAGRKLDKAKFEERETEFYYFEGWNPSLLVGLIDAVKG